MCAKTKLFLFSEAILWAAFIAAQCVWGFCLRFFGFGSKTFLADKVKFASCVIFKEILSQFALPETKRIFASFFGCDIIDLRQQNRSLFIWPSRINVRFLMLAHRGGLLSFSEKFYAKILFVCPQVDRCRR